MLKQLFIILHFDILRKNKYALYYLMHHKTIQSFMYNICLFFSRQRKLKIKMTFYIPKISKSIKEIKILKIIHFLNDFSSIECFKKCVF